MKAIYLAGFANHLWQSTLFVGLMWVVAKLLRRNSAAVRYWVWWAASIKFLVPFALLVALGQQVAWKNVPVVKMAAPAAQVMAELEQPFRAATSTVEAPTAPVVQSAQSSETGPVQPVVPMRPSSRIWGARWFVNVLFAMWLCGIAVGFAFWGRWLVCMREIRKSSSPLELGHAFPVLSSPGQLEPCVIGIFQPTLILPEGIEERLTPAELDAVLAHEMSHVRRRDNLTSAVHVFVETIFWFWPVLRWVRARLIEEREQACDEAVLNSGNTPHVYAEGVLKVCRHYLAAEPAVAAGISGAQLKQRIERIVDYRESLQLSVVRKTGLAIFVLALVAVPVLSGQARAALLAPVQHPAKVAAALLTPVREEAASNFLESAVQVPESPAALPSEPPVQIDSIAPGSSELRAAVFDNAPQGCPIAEAIGANYGEMRLRGAIFTVPVQCAMLTVHTSRFTPERLLMLAYGAPHRQIVGLPDWAKNSSYDVRLKFDFDRSQKPLGWTNELREVWAHDDPRLQVEEEKVFQPYLTRYFNLKVHHEQRAMPIYALVVANGGVKLNRAIDTGGNREGIQNAVPGEKTSEKAISGKVIARGYEIAELASLLELQQGRTVVDQTGLKGKYDFTLSMRLEEMRAWAEAEEHSKVQRPILYSALEDNFGLKLVPTTATVDVVVIDQMDRPPTATAEAAKSPLTDGTTHYTVMSAADLDRTVRDGMMQKMVEDMRAKDAARARN